MPAELELIRRLPADDLAGRDRGRDRGSDGGRDGDGGLELTGVRLEVELPVAAERIVLRECELHEVVFAPEDPAHRAHGRQLQLLDVVLDGCDLSNLRLRDGGLHRVAITRSRLLGFDLNGGRARDLSVHDSALGLASFADCGLEQVRFAGCDLREASFAGARLHNVEFVDCRMAGADFRQARLSRCALRGGTLDGVIGVASLRGLIMPWSDLIGSAGSLAAALGIEVEATEE